MLLGDFRDRWALTEEQRSFGCLRSHRGALPLSELHLAVELRGLNYRLCLRQTFVNVHPQSIEAVYTFPLAGGAAVTGCRLVCEDQTWSGELWERGRARAHFKGAVKGSQQVALVEEERPEIFTMTVGNLAARGLVQVELELVGPLTCLDDMALFRFPLVVGSRFIPGQPLSRQDVGQGTSPDTHRTPDASRVTPPILLAGYPNPVLFSLEIELDSQLWEVERMRSSLPLEVQGRRLYYPPGAGGIDQDLVLAMPLSDSLVSEVQVDESGTFCLTLVAPPVAAARAPLQVALLVDCSAAMDGWALGAARRCATTLLSHLTDQDSLGLWTFADRVSAGKMRPASDDYCGAVLEELEQVRAGGGCQLASALRAVPAGAVVLLISAARVGNEAEVLAVLGGRQVLALGLGAAVNAGLLEQMGWLCGLAQSEEQLEGALRQWCRGLHAPAEVRLEGASELVSSGGPVRRVYGRLQEGFLVRIGSELELTAQACPGRWLEKLWARQRVLQLERDYLMRLVDGPSASALVNLSLEQGVLCRFTAFVAVDAVSRVAQQAYTLVQAVEPVAAVGRSYSYSGSIKVDLLPTEKRGISIHPRVVLLVLAVLAALGWWLSRG